MQDNFYIFSFTNFHRKIAQDIAVKMKVHDFNNISILRKKERGHDGILDLLFIYFKFIFRIGFDRKSHLIVSHPFNPWVSFLLLFSRKVSFFDDGTAYYNNSKTPIGVFPKIYMLLAFKHFNSLKIESLGTDTYLDLIDKSKSKVFYSIFPDLMVNKITNRSISFVKCNLSYERDVDCDNPFLIFLDSSSEIISLLDHKKIINHLETIANNSISGKLLFKAHPSSRSILSDSLSNCSWAEELNENYECYISKNQIDSLFCIYSSAMISTRIISPKSKIYVYTNDELDIRYKELSDLVFHLDVKEIRL